MPGTTLRSALESYKLQLRTMAALFRISGDSGQIPLELWPSWRHEEENISSVTWCLPSRRLRSAICCQILSSNRRIYLRLLLLMQLDMPQGMCPSIKDHSLGLPRRLRQLSGGPSLRLRHPGDALNLRLLLLRRSALKHTLLRSILRPRRNHPIPRGGFRGRSLSSLCGPVAFRGVAPHHRPIHPEHFHCIPAISHGSLPHGRSLLSAQGAVLRVGNCPSCLYTTEGSNIHHSTSLCCRDAPIPRRLVDSS